MVLSTNTKYSASHAQMHVYESCMPYMYMYLQMLTYNLFYRNHLNAGIKC